MFFTKTTRLIERKIFELADEQKSESNKLKPCERAGMISFALMGKFVENINCDFKNNL